MLFESWNVKCEICVNEPYNKEQQQRLLFWRGETTRQQAYLNAAELTLGKIERF